jgi:hypothetical protein
MSKLASILLFALVCVKPTTVNGQYEYVTNADGASITITGYSGPSAVSIPSNIDGLLVTDIGERAFADTSVANVTIPDSVTNIGLEAFDDCQNLTNVVLPDSLSIVGEDAFDGAGLTSITIPIGVTNIGYGAFDVGQTLTNVTIEFGITDIQTYMFAGCGLLNVVIPESITNIEPYAFSQCENLTNVFFTGNAPSVGQFVFAEDRVGPGGEGEVPYYITTAYYLPGKVGWAQFTSNTFIPADPPNSTNAEFVPAVMWNPTIQAAGTSFGLQNGQYGFDITGTTNLPIAIEACDDLSLSNWVVLKRLTITNGLFHFSEPFQPNTPARFYRIGFP